MPLFTDSTAVLSRKLNLQISFSLFSLVPSSAFATALQQIKSIVCARWNRRPALKIAWKHFMLVIVWSLSPPSPSQYKHFLVSSVVVFTEINVRIRRFSEFQLISNKRRRASQGLFFNRCYLSEKIARKNSFV